MQIVAGPAGLAARAEVRQPLDASAITLASALVLVGLIHQRFQLLDEEPRYRGVPLHRQQLDAMQDLLGHGECDILGVALHVNQCSTRPRAEPSSGGATARIAIALRVVRTVDSGRDTMERWLGRVA